MTFGALLRAVPLALVVQTAAASSLPDLVRAQMDMRRHGGMVAAVIAADGSTRTAAAGASGSASVVLDDRTVFEIGSITKVFTTTLLAVMVERNEVRLDEPVAALLPARVRVPERGGRKITLLDLATHTSGLPRLMNNLSPADVRNPYADYTVEQLYAFLSTHQLTRDIGAQYEYSNVGVGLLGHALSLRGGVPYETLVTERVLKPLGMLDTTIALTPAMKTRLAIGFGPDGRPAPLWDIPTLAGAGALRSTLRDMLVFLRAQLSPTGPLASALRSTHEVRARAGRPEMAIALGWHVLSIGDRRVHWHNGGTGGYRTWMGFDEARRLGAVVLTNSTESADAFGVSLVTKGGDPWP